MRLYELARGTPELEDKPVAGPRPEVRRTSRDSRGSLRALFFAKRHLSVRGNLFPRTDRCLRPPLRRRFGLIGQAPADGVAQERAHDRLRVLDAAVENGVHELAHLDQVHIDELVRVRARLRER